jgi:hypothetical protein
MMWKIIHFSDSSGLLKEYQEQKLCSEIIINKRVRVKITIEEGSEIPQDKLKGKPPGSKYPDKNKVEDYIKKDDQKPLEQKEGDDPFYAEDIAF